MMKVLKVTTQGSGKNLVFLHGWGVNSGVWQPLIEILKAECCITTIDLPGYGLNQQQLPTPYNLQTVATMVAEQLPENCILIGWSLGGLVAQQIAHSYPQKLKQLILICSSPKFSANTLWPGIDPKVLDLFTVQLHQDPIKTLSRFLAVQAMGSVNAKHEVKTLKLAVQKYPLPSPMALAEGLQLLQNIDLREQFKSLSTPCRIFLGGLDTLVPVAIAPLIQQLNPMVTVDLLPDAAHAPFISNPESFAKQLMNAID